MQTTERVLVLIHGGGGGDWHPTMAVAERLYRRGHEVRLLCNADNSEGTAFTGILSLVVPPEFELGRVELGNDISKMRQAVIEHMAMGPCHWRLIPTSLRPKFM